MLKIFFDPIPIRYKFNFRLTLALGLSRVLMIFNIDVEILVSIRSDPTSILISTSMLKTDTDPTSMLDRIGYKTDIQHRFTAMIHDYIVGLIYVRQHVTNRGNFGGIVLIFK